jgi:hypothetical protein
LDEKRVEFFLGFLSNIQRCIAGLDGACRLQEIGLKIAKKLDLILGESRQHAKSEKQNEYSILKPSHRVLHLS